MTDSYASRRQFLVTVSTVGLVASAGCAGDSDASDNRSPTDTGEPTDTESSPHDTTTESDDTAAEGDEPTADSTATEETEAESTPEEDATSFEELYSQADRKTLTGNTLSQNTGPFNLDSVKNMLSADNTEAENVAIAATQASQHTRKREDTPATIRYALDELGLNAFADDRIAASGGEVTVTEIYAENDDDSVEKVMVTKVPHNTDISLQYSLIAGEEPGEGDGAIADNNLQEMWDETNEGQYVALDFRVVDQKSDSWNESGWRGFDRVNDCVIIGNAEDDKEVGYTWDGGKYLADLEDIDNSDHTQAFEAFKEINEFYANDVPEREHMIIDSEGGELNLHTVGEDQYEDAVQGLNYQP